MLWSSLSSSCWAVLKLDWNSLRTTSTPTANSAVPAILVEETGEGNEIFSFYFYASVFFSHLPSNVWNCIKYIDHWGICFYRNMLLLFSFWTYTLCHYWSLNSFIHDCGNIYVSKHEKLESSVLEEQQGTVLSKVEICLAFFLMRFLS